MTGISAQTSGMKKRGKKSGDTPWRTKRSTNELTRIMKCEKRSLPAEEERLMRCVSLKMSSENLHGAKGFSHIYRPTVPSFRVSHNGIKRHTHGGITLTEHSFQVALLWHARRLEVKSKMHNGSPKFVGGIWTGVHTTGRWNLTAKV